MNEKEQLQNYITQSAPVINQLNINENEINDLAEERKQKLRFGCGTLILFGFGAGCLCFGLFAVMIDFPDHLLQGIISFALAAFPVVYLFKRLMRAAECKKKIAELEKKREALLNDTTLSWIPQEYHTVLALNLLNSIIQTGRADTMKEAMNQLENDIHNQIMEKAAILKPYIVTKV